MQTVPRVLDMTTGNTVEDKASSPVSARTPPVCVYDLTGTVMTNGGACAMRMPMTRSSPWVAQAAGCDIWRFRDLLGP